MRVYSFSIFSYSDALFAWWLEKVDGSEHTNLYWISANLNI